MTTIDGMLEYDYSSYVQTGDATIDMMFHGELLTWLTTIQPSYGYINANVYADDWEISYSIGNGVYGRFLFRATTKEFIDLFKAKLERKI